MPGKSPKSAYGEFRVFTEWRRKGKWAIRRAFIPSLAAWLLMHGRVYERIIQGMRNRLALGHVHGLAESMATLETCRDHCQRLMNNLNQNFDREDWEPAVAEICNLMGIEPTSEVILDICDDEFETLMTGAPNAGEQDGTRADVHLRDIPNPIPGDTAGRDAEREPQADNGSAASEVRGPLGRDGAGQPLGSEKRPRRKGNRKKADRQPRRPKGGAS